MFLAIEIGGSKLQLYAGKGSGEIMDRTRLPVDRAAGAEGIRAAILTALPALMAKHQPVAIGVGYGGPVDWRTGRVIKSHQIEGWDDFPLADWLTSHTGLSSYVENDSNAAAFGEATLGAGRGFSPVFYTNMGSGVGGGLVIEGELYHGAPPGEVEFGHLRLDRQQTIVEERCSGWAVDARIRTAVLAAPDSRLASITQGAPTGGESQHLRAALAAGDELARRILHETVDDLAFALSHAVHLLHPSIMVLGGGLALIGEPLRAAVAAALPFHLMRVFQPGPVIALAALGEDAVPAGTLALAARRHRR